MANKSQAIRSKRTLSVLVLGLSVIGLASIVVASTHRYRTDGPLDGMSRLETKFALTAKGTATWALPLPNSTVGDIRIESIDPDGVDGLDILGVLVSPLGPNGYGSAVNGARAWPPQGLTGTTPAGAILPGADTSVTGLQVMVGVRHLAGVATGEIRGLRVRYHAGASDFEVILPWSLVVLATM